MSKVTAKVLAAACVCVLAASLTMASEANIDGVSITLPAPVGFCELTRGNAADSRALDTIGQLVAKANGNRLLGMSADCGQLAAWRDGQRLLGDFGQYQSPRSSTASDELFKQTCAVLRTQGEQTFSSVKDDMASKMEETVKNLKVNEQRFAGFLGDDQTACYVAMVQNLRVGNGADVTQLMMLAITAIKGKFVFVNRYTPYVSSATAQETLPKLKATIAALLAANPR